MLVATMQVITFLSRHCFVPMTRFIKLYLSKITLQIAAIPPIVHSCQPLYLYHSKTDCYEPKCPNRNNRNKRAD
jgi:hypothetical protein